uniref:Uncharacterized protein n=1 Tax=Panagrolaimus superbus TaxID=310955 RepID=A0A914YLQ8_9BILA
MSAGRRRELGKTRGYAERHLDAYQLLLQNNPAPWNDTQKALFTASLARTKTYMEKISDHFDKWKEFINDIQDGEYKKAENELLSEWKAKDEYSDLLDELDGIAEFIEPMLGVDIPEHVEAPLQGNLNVVHQGKPTSNIAKFNGEALPPATYGGDSLRETVNAINNMCRQLQNYGVDINNTSMRKDIIDKMPFRERNELTLLTIKEKADTDAILAKMKDYALIAEISSQNRVNCLPDLKALSINDSSTDLNVKRDVSRKLMIG